MIVFFYYLHTFSVFVAFVALHGIPFTMSLHSCTRKFESWCGMTVLSLRNACGLVVDGGS